MGKVVQKKSKARKSVKRATRRRQPEEVITRLAQEGRLAVIGEKAVEESFRLGLSVTQLEGDDIVEIFPNGSRRVLKSLASPAKAS